MNTPNPSGYRVMIDGEQTASDLLPNIDAARTEGRRLADAEPLPCTFSIHDADGAHVEDIARSNGRDLSAQMRAFDATRDANG